MNKVSDISYADNLTRNAFDLNKRHSVLPLIKPDKTAHCRYKQVGLYTSAYDKHCTFA